jgi:predicted small metal-binding protein
MKLIRCRDHGFDCDFEARAESEDEVLQLAAAHAQGIHHLEVTPELGEKVRQSIQDVPKAK